MILYHITIFFFKAELFISIDKVDNNNFSDFVIYQWLLKKLIYLAYSIWPDISFIVCLLS